MPVIPGTLTVSGSAPVDVTAAANTTTINATNSVSPTTSNARVQEFNDDITSTINTGIAVDGWGLALVTDKTDGTITITNKGSITVNDPGADALAALLLSGTGASVFTYSDTTTSSISNDATNTPNSNGLVFQNSDGSNFATVTGAINGKIGIAAVGGTTTLVISGTVTGTSAAISFDNTSHDNTVDLKSTAVITGNLAGSGSDTVKLSGTTNGSFDLNKIASGFTQLVKNDISTWAVTGTFAGDTAVNGGVLQVDGTLGGVTTVGDGFGNPAATLDGVGTLAGISVQNNGILAPGDAGVGTLTFGGNLTMVNGAALQIQIGSASSYDVLHASGTAIGTGDVELGTATLFVSLLSFTPTVGQVFTIIQNDGTDAVGDFFNGLSEGAGFNVGGSTFSVSYVGGDGNDVTLTAITPGTAAPGLTGFGPSADVTQAGPGATPQVLDNDVVFSDPSGNFNGGTLIVSGGLAEDTVSVQQVGFDPGQFFIDDSTATHHLLFEGQDIGTISGGTGGTPLTVTFNSQATTHAVDALIENLTFLDTSSDPTFSRTLSLAVTDAAHASTGPKPITVHVFNGDIESGTPNDDNFTALPGNERIDGGGGVDSITFGFKLTDATVSYAGNTVVIDGPGSHTVLTGFEVFKFTDGTVNNNDSDPLVDDLFYYSKYHDVWNAHLDADADYHNVGWHLGRDPDAFFSTIIYLSANPDVKASGADPLIQFDQSGWKEGRVPSLTFDPRQYLAANPDVAAAHVDPLKHFLQYGAAEGRQPFAPTELVTSNGFDYVYYLQNNPDVAAAGVDPFQHYETIGWKEGRNPNALFDDSGYLTNYPDVAAAHVNPLDHYNQFGWHEGRDPSVNFDTTSYLAAYPDVAAAHINPLAHFLQFGSHEGRSAFADGVWG